MGPTGSNRVVFSDLDGTLLDHETYSWEEARPGLALLGHHQIPLVPSTSKTVAELAALAARIGCGSIGIAENGAVIAWRLTDPPEIEFLGPPYGELRAALDAIRGETALPLTGFGDVDATAICQRAGVDAVTAALSKQRSGDEPFWSERELTPDEVERLRQAVAGRGYRLTRGGRYFHLTGEQDKGTAARRVIERLSSGSTPPRSAAFGDAANDRPLLESVECRYAVRRPGGEIDAVLARVAGVRVTSGVGPAGFSEGVEDLIRRWSRPGGADPPPVDPPAAG